MYDFSIIGMRIKLLRESKGITQKCLAEKVGVSSHFIYEIESNYKSMSLDTFTEIAKALDISADYLLFGDKDAASVVSNYEKEILELLTLASPNKTKSLINALKAILPFTE